MEPWGAKSFYAHCLLGPLTSELPLSILAATAAPEVPLGESKQSPRPLPTLEYYLGLSLRTEGIGGPQPSLAHPVAKALSPSLLISSKQPPTIASGPLPGIPGTWLGSCRTLPAGPRPSSTALEG